MISQIELWKNIHSCNKEERNFFGNVGTKFWSEVECVFWKRSGEMTGILPANKSRMAIGTNSAMVNCNLDNKGKRLARLIYLTVSY